MRDLRKNRLCFSEGIKLVRWPYYFQLTKDVARYFFPNHYTDEKYTQAINIVYGTSKESEILAPGLHGSKFNPPLLVLSKNLMPIKYLTTST